MKPVHFLRGLALAALLVLLLLSLRWVFGAPKPRKVRNTSVLRGTERADGSWDRVSTRRRELR